MVQTTEKSYLNTLIFTVVAEGISILIIGLLALEVVRPFSAFLMTLEIGLIFIIIWTLYAIKKYQDKMSKQFKHLRDTRVTNVSCPDYFTRKADEDGNLICENKYTTPDGKFEYTFNNQKQIGKAAGNMNDINEINMKDVFDEKKLQDICDNELSSSGIYKNIPWTGIKTSCTSLDDYDDYQEYYKDKIYKKLE